MKVARARNNASRIWANSDQKLVHETRENSRSHEGCLYLATGIEDILKS